MGLLADRGNSLKYIYITVRDVTEVAVYERTLLAMNMRDGLTGVYNRRYLDDQLKKEFKRRQRVGRPFSAAIFDIDLFKKVNDAHGHLCGDFVLKSLCSTIEPMLRGTDTLGRYGGEEFLCLLPETSLKDGVGTAERLRKAIEDHTYEFQGMPIKVTISFGVAELDDGIESPQELLKRADEALYEAKRTGRNKVAAAAPSQPV